MDIMDFKKIINDVKSKYDERQERKQEEEEEYLEYQDKINELLDRFEIPDFNDFFMKYLNNKPESWKEEDKDTGRIYTQRPGRKDYLDFAWKYINKEELTYDQVKNYALKKRIVTPSFFGSEDDDQYDQSEFEIIINSIKAGFEPETITNEEHLEAQLMVFLKAKFSERKIRRQVTIQGNDILDILVDDKFAFELKVPRNRSDLRNLGAQLEEYHEQYPNLCAVIFDIDDSNLTQDIIDYSDRYKRNNGVTTIILGGRKRG
jgi:hypothetical protein